LAQFLLKGVYLGGNVRGLDVQDKNPAQHKMEAPNNDKYKQKSISKNTGTTE
jgi:hypothetical protein